MRTPENPENPCCHAQAFIGTPPPQSPFPPPPTPQTTHCSGGKACSGHEDWAGRGGGAPAQPREAQAVQLRESASKGSPCSGVLRGKNSMLWCERGWNTWAFLQLDSVSNLVPNRWKHTLKYTSIVLFLELFWVVYLEQYCTLHHTCNTSWAHYSIICLCRH